MWADASEGSIKSDKFAEFGMGERLYESFTL